MASRRGQAVAALVGAGLGLAAFATLVERAELALIDARAWLFPAPVRTEVVVVGIGDRTLAEWSEPSLFWGSRYADVLTSVRRAGCTGVVYDVVQAVDPDPYVEPPGPVSAWTQEIAADDDVALARIIAADGTPVEPVLALALAADGRVGHINVEVSPDGIYRAVSSSVPGDDGSAPPLARLAAEMAGTDVARLDRVDALAQAGLAYLRPGRVLRQVEALDVVRGGADALLRGSQAVVGWTFSGNDDVLPQPGGRLASGVEIHARSMAAYRFGDFFQRLPRPVEALLAGLMAVAAAWLPRRRGIVARSVAPWAGIGAVVAAAAVAAAYGLLLPVAAPTLALVGVMVTVRVADLAEARLRGVRMDLAFGGSASPRLKEHLLEHGPRLRNAPEPADGTVMFLDMRSSVALGESLGPAEVFTLMNEFLAIGVRCVEAEGGVVVRFLGDGLFAVFGYPEAGEGSTGAAWRAVSALIAEAAKWNHGRAKPVRFGVGLHTGPFAVGYVGDESRQECSVLGDTVNVAARLEGLCKPDKLNADVVASESCGRPDSGFRVSGPHEVPVSGRSQTIRVFAYTHIGSGEHVDVVDR